MYDFPGAPNPGDEYTPLVGGQTYVWNPPRWMVKGVPPLGGGGGGGIDEAPIDGEQYARQDASWAQIDIPEGSWDSITDKPATFPPTVPIPWTDVSGKPATFPPTVPIPWTEISDKPATFPPTLPIPWTDVSGKPTTFPPAAHIHPQSDVTGLVTDLGLKAPKASPVFTGTPRSVTPFIGDDSEMIATSAFVQYTTTAAVNGVVGTASAGMNTLGEIEAYINDTILVEVNSKVGEAPADGLYYGRQYNAWQVIVEEAPSDSTPYARQDGMWVSAASDVVTWDDVTDKPDTFPPTLPIAQSDVTGLEIALSTLTSDMSAVNVRVDGVESTANGAAADIISLQDQDTVHTDNINALSVEVDGKVDEAPSTGLTYGRNNSTWVEIATGGGGAVADVGDAAPADPVQGQLWFDSSTANLYIWYDDGTSAQWIQVNATGAA